MTSALGNEVKAAIGETHVVWVTEGPAPSLPVDALRVTGGRPHVESRQAWRPFLLSFFPPPSLSQTLSDRHPTFPIPQQGTVLKRVTADPWASGLRVWLGLTGD